MIDYVEVEVVVNRILVELNANPDIDNLNRLAINAQRKSRFNEYADCTRRVLTMRAQLGQRLVRLYCASEPPEFVKAVIDDLAEQYTHFKNLKP